MFNGIYKTSISTRCFSQNSVIKVKRWTFKTPWTLYRALVEIRTYSNMFIQFVCTHLKQTVFVRHNTPNSTQILTTIVRQCIQMCFFPAVCFPHELTTKVTTRPSCAASKATDCISARRIPPSMFRWKRDSAGWISSSYGEPLILPRETFDVNTGGFWSYENPKKLLCSSQMWCW